MLQRNKICISFYISYQNENDNSLVQNSTGEPTDIFSFCFSSSQDSLTANFQDGSQGCEHLVYFPSFLPALLRVIKGLLHSSGVSIASGADIPVSGIKRKGHFGISTKECQNIEIVGLLR